MGSHGFVEHEIADVAETCKTFRLGEQLPPELQQFMVQRLQSFRPDLAARVERMDAEAFMSLVRDVRHWQNRDGWSGGGAVAPLVEED